MHPLHKHHIHASLLREPVTQHLPLLLGIGKPEIVHAHERRDELDDLHHGDVAADADAGTGSELDRYY